MSVQDYSTTPGSNTSISGINIGENCPAANVNGAIRQFMADVKVMYNALPDVSAYVTKSGGVFIANPTFSGRGGYVHMNDVANTSGRVFVQPAGGAAPSMSNGDWLLEYT
jgi:hypothetical protein